MNSRENELTVAQANALQRLKKQIIEVVDVNEEDVDEDHDDDEENRNLNYAAKIKSNVEKRMRANETGNYINMGWIPATSCEAERLFSLCRRIFSEFRRAMTPYTLEMLCYMRVNRNLRDI